MSGSHESGSPGAGGARRRAVALAVLRSGLTAVVVTALYFLFPLRILGIGPVLLLIGGAVVFGVALTVQLRAIRTATLPSLRAIEAIGILLPLAVLVFAAIYFVLSSNDPHAFTEPLNRVGALYFSVTVLATVGFGDIAAQTDSARLLVTAQMLIDLVLVATVIRLIASAVVRRSPEER